MTGTANTEFTKIPISPGGPFGGLVSWRVIVRVMAFSMILVLLTVRLGSLSKDVFVTPVEDAIFDVSFVSTADKGPQAKPLFVNLKYVLDCDLPQDEVSIPGLFPFFVAQTPCVPVFSPHEVVFEIFIPPEAHI